MDCECGLSYSEESPEDRKFHRVHHNHVFHGLPVTTRLIATGGLTSTGHLLIRSSAKRTPYHRTFFVKLAALARSSMQEYPSGYYGSEDEDEIGREVIARVVDKRAVALVIVRRDNRAWRCAWRDQDLWLLSRSAETTLRVVVERTWVAHSYRRQGLARTLLMDIASMLNEDPCNLIWEIPFTDAGRSLVHSICPGEVLLDGDTMALSETIAGVVDEFENGSLPL